MQRQLNVIGVLVLLFALLLAGCAAPATSPKTESSPLAQTESPNPAGTADARQPQDADLAAGDNAHDSQTQDGDTLRLLSWQAPTNLNPHLARGSKDYLASRVTYEPLASYNQAGELVPFLAAEIPTLENGGVAEDGLSVTWQLKQDVRWSDGEPFTAQDVVTTYALIANPDSAATSGAFYGNVESVEALDDYTVKITFTEVHPAWSLPFVGPRGMILPHHIFGEYASLQDAPATMLPVGTGPYQAVEFVAGDVVIYAPNPHFREDGKPYFSRVELKGGGDAPSAARAVLQTGDVDYAANLQVEPQVLEPMLDRAVGSLVIISKPLVEHILINHTDPNKETSEGERSSMEYPHPFFADLQVRQAFAMAIDRESIANQLYGANGEATSNILVEPAPYRSLNTSFTYDPQQAAALLDEAGWSDSDGDGVRDKDGIKMAVLFQTSTGSVREKTQEIVKQNLTDIGVEVELKSITPAVFFDNDPANPDTYSHFYADLQMFTIPYDSPDPGAYMQGWICDEIPTKANDWSANNIERWCNPDYDALYEQSTREMDAETRRDLFIQMNDLLINDVAIIPLVHRKRVVGVSNTLAGVELTPWDEGVWNIKDWTRN
jgi:peptide/nickel transport system substrate-binding protein